MILTLATNYLFIRVFAKLWIYIKSHLSGTHFIAYQTSAWLKRIPTSLNSMAGLNDFRWWMIQIKFRYFEKDCIHKVFKAFSNQIINTIILQIRTLIKRLEAFASNSGIATKHHQIGYGLELYKPDVELQNVISRTIAKARNWRGRNCY